MGAVAILPFLEHAFSPTLAQQLGYSDKDVLVIVNIDDVGIHDDETKASFSTLKFGLVKSGSIMVPCTNFLQVMELWRKNPEFELGVHLTLTCEWGERCPWSPVLPRTDVPSLYNPDGMMWRSVQDLLRNAKRKEIEMELDAQINKILDAGLKPSHLDHHMDFYYHHNLFSYVMELSSKYALPMRVWKRRRFRLPFVKKNLISLRKKGYVFPDTQMGIYTMGGQDQSFDFRKAKYHEYLRSLKPGVNNIKIHTALKTTALLKIFGEHDVSIRQIDYDVWTSDDTKKLAEDLGILFIGYRPLQQLQIKLMNSR